jgi:hypothetical protein
MTAAAARASARSRALAVPQRSGSTIFKATSPVDALPIAAKTVPIPPLPKGRTTHHGPTRGQVARRAGKGHSGWFNMGCMRATVGSASFRCGLRSVIRPVYAFRAAGTSHEVSMSGLLRPRGIADPTVWCRSGRLCTGRPQPASHQHPHRPAIRRVNAADSRFSTSTVRTSSAESGRCDRPKAAKQRWNPSKTGTETVNTSGWFSRSLSA